MRFIGLALLLSGATAWGADLRVGIIGCDTSHVIAFTETWNQTNAPGHVPGGKVVAAYRGGSPDIPESVNRLEDLTTKLKDQHGVKFYDSIAELCANVDVICLESLDGRPHLEQARVVIAAGKPLFIDKPMAGSLRDAAEIFRLAAVARVPVFSSSSLRFAKNTEAVRAGAIGRVKYAETYGPCKIEPHHPDLYWYGVHGVEALFTVMGPGCQTVQRGVTTNGMIEVVGIWPGGRKGVFREDKAFHGRAEGEKGEMTVGAWDGYVPLVEAIMKFFQTGIAPVKPEETLEILAFMEAADESKRQGGAAVKMQDVLKAALPRTGNSQPNSK